MKQPKHSETVLFPSCPVCGKPVHQNKRGTAYYCSDACKQTAYRQRHGLVADKAEHYRKIIETKRSQFVMVTCQHCDRLFEVSQVSARTMYCSDACKQAAYRQRLAERLDYEKTLSKTATIDSWDDLPSVLRSLSGEYFARHGVNWTLAFVVAIRPDGRSCFVDTQSDNTYWFQDRDTARRFLVDYVVHGWAKLAMLRQR